MTCPTWKRSESGAHPRGFTLLELLLVICVMSLMLGLSLPRIGAVRQTFLAAEEARRVAGFLRSARHEAVVHRTTVSLTLADGGRNVLEQRRLPSGIWPGDEIAESLLQGGVPDLVDEAEVTRRTGITGRLRMMPDDGAILFFANGTSTGGEIQLLARDGAPRHRYRVDPATGGVHLQPGPGS